MTTLRDAIVAAHRAAGESDHAERERSRLLVIARHHGVTVRELAALLGVSTATAHHWSGGTRTQREAPNALDKEIPWPSS